MAVALPLMLQYSWPESKTVLNVIVQSISLTLGLLLSLVFFINQGKAQDIVRDLPYGPHPSQCLDLAVPSGNGFSTVIFIHGGSLTSGDKTDEDYRNVCIPFVDAGIACANVNYRLAPEAWPKQVEDAAAAVAWVQTNIGKHGGDPNALFLFGHSSGAMLVAILGTDKRYLARHGMKPSDLRGVIPMGSIMWDDELAQAIEQHGRGKVDSLFSQDSDYRIYGSLEAYLDHWPIRHIQAGQPPFLFLIAEGEQEHPPVLKTNMKFVEDSRGLGNQADYKVLPGRTHMSAIRKFSETGDPVFGIVLDFVRKFGGDRK